MKNPFNFLKRKLKVIEYSVTMKNPSDFHAGEIYKMTPGYYTKKPYFVRIKSVGTFHIETEIPLHHSLRMPFPSLTWDYQIPRMTYAGIGKGYDKLLYNQKLD